MIKIEPALDPSQVRRYLLMARQQLLDDRRYTALQVYFDVDPV